MQDMLRQQHALAEDHHQFQMSTMREKLELETSSRAAMERDMAQLLERMHSWRARMQEELDQERHAQSDVKSLLASSREEVKRLQASQRESREHTAANKAAQSDRDSLNCELLQKLQAAQAECPRLHAEIASFQAKYADLQHRTHHLAAEHKAAGEHVHIEALQTAQDDASELRNQCDRLTDRAERAESGMLNCCRRADAAERQLQRREAEAAHLAQKQTDTEAALSALQEQHTQASAAAAARQLVLQTQEHNLRAAQDQAAQSSAKALRVQEDLQEAERRLMVLAEDDRDLRDKVHALTEALSLATERLAAASIAEKSFASGELKMAKVLHAAAAEVDVQRDIAAKAEAEVRWQERDNFRLASSLADAQAELAESRNRMAEISEGHAAELAARANVAALQQTALANERATSAKLSAEVQNLKGTLALLEERVTNVAGGREHAEAELALANGALAACKRQVDTAWAENISLVEAVEQAMQSKGALGHAGPPD
ncbi:hypothetical protein CVIRNUC_003122 [Coccomyxa viridis]|uniref:Uncharacterized protein n=1 Tax=Coccomyxa viridis TaxID=1274662 RepID=A0AAV1HZK2_9CHLO|nr:hypothetical protein CVIRNUC_003122 [Coccomyxa viridis]